MNKLLFLVCLVGCVGTDYKQKSVENVEQSYPHLRCVKGSGDFVLCRDLDNIPYVCFSTATTWPSNVVCLEGVVPPRSRTVFQYVPSDTLTVTGNVPLATTTNIDTYYSFGVK